jgi:ADP-ribose pyrophosphatase YjhB (NUDIX family)
MFKFCPGCASPGICFENERVFRCPSCGLEYYQNIATATGCIIDTGTSVVFVVRAKEPAKGKLALPGGFVDVGEGAVEGVRRECREEIGWDPGPVCSFLASFPNVYHYKGFVYHTCDLFFTVSAPGLTVSDLVLDPGEIAGVRFIRYDEIDFDDLAFDSTRRAVQIFLPVFLPALRGHATR